MKIDKKIWSLYGGSLTQEDIYGTQGRVLYKLTGPMGLANYYRSFEITAIFKFSFILIVSENFRDIVSLFGILLVREDLEVRNQLYV